MYLLRKKKIPSVYQMSRKKASFLLTFFLFYMLWGKSIERMTLFIIYYFILASDKQHITVQLIII